MRIAVIILIATCIVATHACVRGLQKSNSKETDRSETPADSENTNGLRSGADTGLPEGRELPDGDEHGAKKPERKDIVDNGREDYRFDLGGRPSPRFPPRYHRGNRTDGPHHNGTRPHHNETSHEHRPHRPRHNETSHEHRPHRPHHNETSHEHRPQRRHHNESDSSSSHEGRRPYHPRHRGPKRHSSESHEEDIESGEKDIENPDIKPEDPIEGEKPEQPNEDGSGYKAEQDFLP